MDEVFSSRQLAKASKRMSFLLRHHPEMGNLALDSEGWVSVEDILTTVNIDRALFNAVVAQSDKNRFEVVNDRVRARQGHSIPVELNLTPVTPPAQLYHGTSENVLELIMADGLRPMDRQYVHLSPTISVAEEVAGRRRGASVILAVDGNALSAASEVFCSSNGVFLTSFVPASALSRVKAGE